MTKRKQASYDKCIKELAELLELINKIEEQDDPIERVFGETQKEEAILRLKEFGVASFVIKNFERGQVQISDIGGIIYDLDDFAKEFVEYLESKGHMPYMVLRNGPMYSVLYVNANKECWANERYDKKSELVLAYCTMVDMGIYCMDRGDIRVQKTNAGGLTRI